MGKFSHTPARPPRRGHWGEAAFLEAWLSYINSSIDPDNPCSSRLEEILHGMCCQVTERHATVLASLAVWLGTNCGAAFVAMATRHLVDSAKDPYGTTNGEAFLAAWARQNFRRTWLNRGTRTLEQCLATVECKYDGVLTGYVEPELSANDAEAADHFMYWLGSADGQEFLASAEALSRRGPQRAAGEG